MPINTLVIPTEATGMGSLAWYGCRPSSNCGRGFGSRLDSMFGMGLWQQIQHSMQDGFVS